jgi:hypothetical protein
LPSRAPILLALTQSRGTVRLRTVFAHSLAPQTLGFLSLGATLQRGSFTVFSGPFPLPKFLRPPARFDVAAFPGLILPLRNAARRKEET